MTRGMRWAALVITTSCYGCSSEDDAARDPNAERFARVVKLMQDDHAERGVPGGAVAVVIDGKLAYSAGVGVKALGGSDPVTPDTLFRVASLTKLHVALAALSLADEGKLAIDGPVTAHVPELGLAAGFDPSLITPHHLMTHTSGLPDRNPLTVPDWLDCTTTVSEHFATLQDKPLWTNPGEIYNYSNQGYSLLGLVIERAGGAPFDQVVEQRVLAPGGLAAHTFDVTEMMQTDHALGHQVFDGQLSAPFEPEKYECGIDAPAAQLMTSVTGLAKLAEVLLNDGAGIISADAALKMRTPHTPTHTAKDASYGYGLERELYKGLELWGHGGDYYGYRTELAIVVDKGFAVAVIENRSPGSPGRTIRTALDEFLGLGEIEQPKETKTAAELAAYVGVYSEPYTFGNVDVKALGDGLELNLLNGVYKLPAEFVGGNMVAFEFEGTPATATFWPGPSGSFDLLASRAGVGRRVTQ